MLILNLQRMSTEDGPGIRTTLFVKGCPLECKWCHNPESISSKKLIEWIKARCIGCGTCVSVCDVGAITQSEQGILIDRDKCVLCLKCCEECPTLAIECKGEEKSVKELFEELIKDKAYFGKEGGVTLSGGEILMQSKEAGELLSMLKREGIHTAIDTSGFCKREDFDRVFDYTDLFLYDIKIIDDKEHIRYIGQSNKIILDNFNYLSNKIKGTDKKLWVRTPIIPMATDSEENIRGIAQFLKGKNIDKWELCTFNNLCKDKYERLYLNWQYNNVQLMTKEIMEELKEIALAEGVENVIWTGTTRL